jgi:hypothetical protein
MAVRLEHVETLTLARGRQAFTIHREYLLFAPPGWQRWWLESQKKYSRGLPLVVSLHGAGMDHHLMAYQWQYDSAWRDDLDHQFFVLVPGGTLTLDGLSSTDEPFRPFDEKLIWNGSDTAVETSRDDVALVRGWSTTRAACSAGPRQTRRCPSGTTTGCSCTAIPTAPASPTGSSPKSPTAGRRSGPSPG